MKTSQANQKSLDNVVNNYPVDNVKSGRKSPKSLKNGSYKTIIRKLQCWVKRNSQIRSVRMCCSFAVEAVVSLTTSPNGNACFLGLNRCRNTTSCPVCSYERGLLRARQITEVARPIYETGGTAVLLTLTIPHDITDGLKQQVQKLNQAWNRLIRGEFGKKCARFNKNDCSLWVRSFDWTTGQNGNHSHLHNQIYFETAPTKQEFFELRTLCWKKWLKIVFSIFKRNPRRDCFEMEEIYDVEGVANYTNKIASFAFEVACGGSIHTKAKGGGLNVWGLLDAIEKEENQAKREILTRKWRMFEDQTRKLRTITFSKTFRERIEELEEEEDIKNLKDNNKENKVQVELRADLFKLIKRKDDTANVLELFEAFVAGEEAAEPIAKEVQAIASKFSIETEYFNQNEMEKDWGFVAFKIQRWKFYRTKPEFYTTPHNLLISS